MDVKRLFICHNGRGSIIRQRLDFFGAGSKASGVDRNPSSDRRYHVSGCSESYAAAELNEFLVDRGVVVVTGNVGVGLDEKGCEIWYHGNLSAFNYPPVILTKLWNLNG